MQKVKILRKLLVYINLVIALMHSFYFCSVSGFVFRYEEGEEKNMSSEKRANTRKMPAPAGPTTSPFIPPGSASGRRHQSSPRQEISKALLSLSSRDRYRVSHGRGRIVIWCARAGVFINWRAGVGDGDRPATHHLPSRHRPSIPLPPMRPLGLSLSPCRGAGARIGTGNQKDPSHSVL